MEINATMDLDELLQRMGDATLAEAERFRDILVAEFDGRDTTDIEDDDWCRMLDAACE